MTSTLAEITEAADEAMRQLKQQSQETIAIRLSDIRGEYINQKVSAKVFISGQSKTKAHFTKYSAHCMSCNEKREIDLLKNGSEPDLALLLWHIRQDERSVWQQVPSEGCKESKSGEHDWRSNPIDPALSYSELAIRDLMNNGECDLINETASKNYSAFAICRVPEGKDTQIEGVLVSNPKTDEVSVLITKMEATQKSITNFELTTMDKIQLKAFSKTLTSYEACLKIAEKNNPRIARHVEAKLSSLLCWTSPTWIKINDQVIFGTLRVIFFGDPRQGKGQIETYLQNKMKLGHHAVGETASRTGITYTIDTEKGLIIWGKLVEADRGLLVIEALHMFPPDDLASMREALVKLKVEVNRAISEEAQARTRIIADSNLNGVDMQAITCKLSALRYLPCFKDQVDITRYDVMIPFQAKEVTREEITRAILEGKDDPEFIESMKLLSLWAWSRKPEQFQFTEEAKNEAASVFNELLDKYGIPEIPVVHEASFFSILRIASSFAVLSYSTDDGMSVLVKKEHVQWTKKFLERMYDMLDIEEYKAINGTSNLTNEEYTFFESQMRSSDVAYAVVTALLAGPLLSSDLERITGHEQSSIRRTAGLLKDKGFIRKESKGYRLTGKGVESWKKVQASNATNATNATGKINTPSNLTDFSSGK